MTSSSQKMKMVNAVKLRHKSNSKEVRSHFHMIRFIFEACRKLETSQLTVASAACIYHRFYQEMPTCDYDQQLVAGVAIYLAGKIEENHQKIRDVINVCHRMVHRTSEPLGLGDEYFDLRDSFVQLELLVLRVLRFEVTFTHPHKYLLHYFWSLSQWIGSEMWTDMPVLQTAWAFIQDFLHNPSYLKYKPQHLAVGAIYLAFQCYGVIVPMEGKSDVNWFEAFDEDLDEDKLWNIASAIIENYNKETEIHS